MCNGALMYNTLELIGMLLLLVMIPTDVFNLECSAP